MFELLTTQTSAAGIREAGARSGLGLVLDDNDRKVVVSRKSLIGHSSPVMQKVEDKTNTILEKLRITSGKSTLF